MFNEESLRSLISKDTLRNAPSVARKVTTYGACNPIVLQLFLAVAPTKPYDSPSLHPIAMFALPDRKRPRIESEDDVFVKQEPHWPAATLIATDHDTINAQPNSIQELQPEPLDNGGAGRQRDAEFWFGDGTVILVAGDVEFRIYKGLLADYSSVFKTMFAKQHPVRPMPIDERHSIPCPVIRLKDSPQDLRHILRAYVSRK